MVGHIDSKPSHVATPVMVKPAAIPESIGMILRGDSGQWIVDREGRSKSHALRFSLFSPFAQNSRVLSYPCHPCGSVVSFAFCFSSGRPSGSHGEYALWRKANGQKRIASFPQQTSSRSLPRLGRQDILRNVSLLSSHGKPVRTAPLYRCRRPH